MLPEALLLVGAALTPQAPPEPLLGCLHVPALVDRIDGLRDADWRQLDRLTFLRMQDPPLDATDRDPDTREWVGFRRSGRIINGVLECGENYLFHSPVGSTVDYLKEVFFAHAELTRAAALRVAESLAAAVRAPEDAGPVQEICLDCGDRGRSLVDREWREGNVVSTLQVFLRSGTDSFILALTSSRRLES